MTPMTADGSEGRTPGSVWICEICGSNPTAWILWITGGEGSADDTDDRRWIRRKNSGICVDL